MILEGYFAIELHIGFDELERYLEITEEYLQKAKAEFETWVDEESKTLSLEGRDEFNESYEQEYWDYAETFPRILRSSFFVSVYSLFENKMALICKWLKKDKQIIIGWRDLRGDTLDQFKLYCKLGGLRITYDDQNWNEINEYRRIRNCIIHNRGLIQGANEEKKLLAYVKRKNIVDDLFVGMSIRSQPQIALTAEFCKEVIKTMWAFLSTVLQAYELQRQVLKKDDVK
jgi:hypothetical protein